MANSLKNLVKTGFGLGVGLYLAQILFLLFGGMIFFVGYSMLQTRQKRGSPQSEKYFPLFLMGVGVVVMGGVGFGFLLEAGADIFE